MLKIVIISIISILFIAIIVLSILALDILLYRKPIDIYREHREVLVPLLKKIGPGNYTLTEYEEILRYDIRDKYMDPGIVYRKTLYIDKLDNVTTMLLGDYYIIVEKENISITPLRIDIYRDGIRIPFDELYVHHFTEHRGKEEYHVYVSKYSINLTKYIPANISIEIALDKKSYIKQFTLVINHIYNKTYYYPYPTYILKGHEPLFLNYVVNINYEKLNNLIIYIISSQILIAITLIILTIYILQTIKKTKESV